MTTNTYLYKRLVHEFHSWTKIGMRTKMDELVLLACVLSEDRQLK